MLELRTKIFVMVVLPGKLQHFIKDPMAVPKIHQDRHFFLQKRKLVMVMPLRLKYLCHICKGKISTSEIRI